MWLRDAAFRPCVSNRRDIVNPTSHPLRVVEQVKSLHLERELGALGQCEGLARGHINVVDRRQLQGVAAHIGLCAIARLHILSAWIRRQVSHYANGIRQRGRNCVRASSNSVVAQRNYTGPGSRLTCRVENRPIWRRVPVQVRINVVLSGHPFS